MPPPKTPAELNELRGNPGKRGNAIVPIEVLPASHIHAPEDMSEEGRAIWDRLAPDLIAVNLLRRTDAATFAILCEAFAEAKLARIALETEGYVYDTVTEHVAMKRLHPMFLVLDRARRIILQYADHFGLTPAARQSIFTTELARDPRAATPASSDEPFDMFAREPLPLAGPGGAPN